MVLCLVSTTAFYMSDRLIARPGFGEIFAIEWVSIYFGIGPHSEPGAPTRRRTANVSSVGLRGAGERGGGNVRPDHPAAKSAIEVAAETALNG